LTLFFLKLSIRWNIDAGALYYKIINKGPKLSLKHTLVHMFKRVSSYLLWVYVINVDKYIKNTFYSTSLLRVNCRFCLGFKT